MGTGGMKNCRVSPSEMQNQSRSDQPFLKKILVLIASILVLGPVLAQEGAHNGTPCDKLGWELAVHAYTFRKFTIFECINKTAALGLKYMSISGNVILEGTN